MCLIRALIRAPSCRSCRVSKVVMWSKQQEMMMPEKKKPALRKKKIRLPSDLRYWSETITSSTRSR